MTRKVSSPEGKRRAQLRPQLAAVPALVEQRPQVRREVRRAQRAGSGVVEARSGRPARGTGRGAAPRRWRAAPEQLLLRAAGRPRPGSRRAGAGSLSCFSSARNRASSRDQPVAHQRLAERLARVVRARPLQRAVAERERLAGRAPRQLQDARPCGGPSASCEQVEDVERAQVAGEAHPILTISRSSRRRCRGARQPQLRPRVQRRAAAACPSPRARPGASCDGNGRPTPCGCERGCAPVSRWYMTAHERVEVVRGREPALRRVVGGGRGVRVRQAAEARGRRS